MYHKQAVIAAFAILFGVTKGTHVWWVGPEMRQPSSVSYYCIVCIVYGIYIASV
jgi:hypothetical protein